jgi:hypothetical protein
MNNIVLSLLVALIGGLIGTYCGSYFLHLREENKMKKVQNIAIRALGILKKYAKQSYREAENEFNNTLTITEKRTVIVALHKLGVPFELPYNEMFDIKKMHFVDKVIDGEEIEAVILQINKGYCDNLFYLDPDSYFAENTSFAKRNVAKKYVREVLSKSRSNKNHLVSYPNNWNDNFGVGEFQTIRVFHERVCFDFLFDSNGIPIPEKMDQIIHEIDLGLWDDSLQMNYEVYKNVKAQIEINDTFQVLAAQQQQNAGIKAPNGDSNQQVKEDSH